VTRSDDKRLDDIRRMCALVAGLVARGRPAFEADEALWLALERAIEVAGEAATQLSEGTRAEYPTVEWRELMAVRVILAHAYHRVDVDLLWGIARRDLPRLCDTLGPLGGRGDG